MRSGGGGFTGGGGLRAGPGGGGNYKIHSSFYTILNDKSSHCHFSLIRKRKGGKIRFAGLNVNQDFYVSRLHTYCKTNIPLNPNYITGFSDGEATFYISIYKNNKYKTG